MTPNFSDAELACKCGCGMLPDKMFMNRVEMLRAHCGFPFKVTSAARCPEHNARVSKTGRTGPHTTGRAIDIAVRGEQALKVIEHALLLRFTGIGVQQKGLARFIHVDLLPNGPGCPRPNIWSY